MPPPPVEEKLPRQRRSDHRRPPPLIFPTNNTENRNEEHHHNGGGGGGMTSFFNWVLRRNSVAATRKKNDDDDDDTVTEHPNSKKKKKNIVVDEEGGGGEVDDGDADDEGNNSMSPTTLTFEALPLRTQIQVIMEEWVVAVGAGSNYLFVHVLWYGCFVECFRYIVRLFMTLLYGDGNHQCDDDDDDDGEEDCLPLGGGRRYHRRHHNAQQQRGGSVTQWWSLLKLKLFGVVPPENRKKRRNSGDRHPPPLPASSSSSAMTGYVNLFGGGSSSTTFVMDDDVEASSNINKHRNDDNEYYDEDEEDDQREWGEGRIMTSAHSSAAGGAATLKHRRGGGGGGGDQLEADNDDVDEKKRRRKQHTSSSRGGGGASLWGRITAGWWWGLGRKKKRNKNTATDSGNEQQQQHQQMNNNPVSCSSSVPGGNNNNNNKSHSGNHHYYYDVEEGIVQPMRRLAFGAQQPRHQEKRGGNESGGGNHHHRTKSGLSAASSTGPSSPGRRSRRNRRHRGKGKYEQQQTQHHRLNSNDTAASTDDHDTSGGRLLQVVSSRRDGRTFSNSRELSGNSATSSGGASNVMISVQVGAPASPLLPPPSPLVFRDPRHRHRENNDDEETEEQKTHRQEQEQQHLLDQQTTIPQPLSEEVKHEQGYLIAKRGKMLNGFQLVSELGHGAYSTVWLAVDAKGLSSCYVPLTLRHTIVLEGKGYNRSTGVMNRRTPEGQYVVLKVSRKHANFIEACKEEFATNRRLMTSLQRIGGDLSRFVLYAMAFETNEAGGSGGLVAATSSSSNSRQQATESFCSLSSTTFFVQVGPVCGPSLLSFIPHAPCPLLTATMKALGDTVTENMNQYRSGTGEWTSAHVPTTTTTAAALRTTGRLLSDAAIAVRDALDAALWSVSGIQKLTRNMLLSLAALHKSGIVHTDLKPENLLLSLPAAEVVDKMQLGHAEWSLAANRYRIFTDPKAYDALVQEERAAFLKTKRRENHGDDADEDTTTSPPVHLLEALIESKEHALDLVTECKLADLGNSVACSMRPRGGVQQKEQDQQKDKESQDELNADDDDDAHTAKRTKKKKKTNSTKQVSLDISAKLGNMDGDDEEEEGEKAELFNSGKEIRVMQTREYRSPEVIVQLRRRRQGEAKTAKNGQKQLCSLASQLPTFGVDDEDDKEDKRDDDDMDMVSPGMDIWSVACIVFELLTGDYLFNPRKELEELRLQNEKKNSTADNSMNIVVSGGKAISLSQLCACGCGYGVEAEDTSEFGSDSYRRDDQEERDTPEDPLDHPHMSLICRMLRSVSQERQVREQQKKARRFPALVPTPPAIMMTNGLLSKYIFASLYRHRDVALLEGDTHNNRIIRDWDVQVVASPISISSSDDSDDEDPEKKKLRRRKKHLQELADKSTTALFFDMVSGGEWAGQQDAVVDEVGDRRRKKRLDSDVVAENNENKKKASRNQSSMSGAVQGPQQEGTTLVTEVLLHHFVGTVSSTMALVVQAIEYLRVMKKQQGRTYEPEDRYHTEVTTEVKRKLDLLEKELRACGAMLDMCLRWNPNERSTASELLANSSWLQ